MTRSTTTPATPVLPHTRPTAVPDAPPRATGQARPPGRPGRVAGLLPGIALCAAVSALAVAVEWGETRLFGRAWLEALVLAILLGAALRTAWTPGPRLRPGIGFSAKALLEVAVMLLGASISARTIVAAGPALLLGIAATVVVAVCASYGLGRALRLPPRMAILVACGNSICGNSAIAAVAPVIGADGEDVACSIAFTAVLGVIVVLALPLLVPVLQLSGLQYGVLAGLTVYAVPQVLAATAPIGPAAVQIGTLVKLVRVLMLGPVVVALSLLCGRLRQETDGPAPHVAAGGPPASGASRRPAPSLPPLGRMVPWFIVGFLAFAGLRSADLLPGAMLAPMATAAGLLTILSMAALGLGVDVRVVARAGTRVIATVSLSLLLLGGVSLGLIRLLAIP